MEERVLAFVRLKDSHRPTGKTRHYLGGELLSAPAELKIVQIGGEIYLIHFDALGNEVTDTWHDSLENAKEQAAFEFNVSDADWE